MTYIFKEIAEDRYKTLSLRVSVPLTQCFFYGEWQRMNGRSVWRYEIDEDGRPVGFFQLIKFPLPLGKSYLYIPRGPVFIEPYSEKVPKHFKNFGRELLDREKSMFLRLDLSGIGFRSPNFTYDGNFQPKYEWVLDLSVGEGEILALMKKVNRYTIRQAEKLNVEVEILDKDLLKYLDKFYELIKKTAGRDGFSHNTKEYYRKVFERCELDQNGFISVARWNGEIMLINFFVIYGKTAFFLFSGSEDQNRKIGYTYLAQWEVIKYSKRRGLRWYNFGAVIKDYNEYPFYKNWRGFSDFKRRFGGMFVEYADSYDLVRSKFWYSLYIVRKIISLLKRRVFDFLRLIV